MKNKKSFAKKLKLNKESIVGLNTQDMSAVAGGSGDTCPAFCCCDTSVIISATHQNPCPVPFTEAPISVCC